MEKQKNDIIKGIRACLISTKGKLPIRQLDRDYKTLLGHRIPYLKLGFQTLEDFILSEPSLVLSKINGEVFVDARVSEKSVHITEMVDKQRIDKKKGLRKTVRFTSHSEPAKTFNWRPNDVRQNGKRFKSSPRPAAVSHNQFVNYPRNNRPTVPSKIIIPESSNLYNKYQPNTIHKQNPQQKKTDINLRLHVNVASERSVTNNGQSISIQNNLANKDSADDINSSRKRITKKMSEMNLDRDSGNSSPTGEANVHVNIEQPVKAAFVLTGDPIKDLKKFVEFYKIGELEVSTKYVSTKQNHLYTCKMKVAKHIYTSYPEEFRKPIEAENYCAKEALKDLETKYGRRKSLLLASDKDILERIPPMLEKHHHGIWDWQLRLDYADKYKEELPFDWLKIIDSSPCIQIEKCLDNCVLRHCKPGDKGQKWSTFMTLSDVSVPSNTVQFGSDGTLYAEITCIMSANEIWCRQCGTEESEVYSDMIGKMEIFYNENENSLRADSVTEASYYVAKYDDNSWCRIRAVAVKETEVQCFFIDYGDEMAVPKSRIYQLKREFASSQAQAFVCRLVGLEELYEMSVNSEKLQSILYKQIILEMANDIADADKLTDLSIPVYMYDFSSGKSINQQLIPLLTIESASPVLQKDSITEVYVSNIESNGDVYVQLRTHGYNSLQKLLEDLELQIMENPPTHLLSLVTKANSKDKIYFAKYKVDGHWYRIQLIDWSPKEDLAQIYFIDYGNTDVVNVNQDVLYPLDKLSEVLSQYPAQAIKVRMAIDAIPQDFVSLASKAMPLEQPVLLKILEYDNENVPWVEFFKNAEGGLFCINKSVTIESEIKKGDGNNNLKSSKRNLLHFDAKNVPSGGKLQCPQLPDNGQLFEIHVPFAVNPYNFFVQPLCTRDELNRMMKQLQERYKNVHYSPLQVDHIVPGNIYVSRFDDGNWYRISVIKVIHSGSISVFYCDFGYYGSLNVQQLVPLDVEFMELPFQALKAKLSDIKPKQQKWTMEDCDFFKDLVEKKNFYSLIVDKEKDELYESDTVLKLILIDTSSSQDDVYIGKELIKKGIAVDV